MDPLHRIQNTTAPAASADVTISPDHSILGSSDISIRFAIRSSLSSRGIWRAREAEKQRRRPEAAEGRATASSATLCKGCRVGGVHGSERYVSGVSTCQCSKW